MFLKFIKMQDFIEIFQDKLMAEQKSKEQFVYEDMNFENEFNDIYFLIHLEDSQI